MSYELNIGYTCPIIDVNIESIKSNFEDYIDGLTERLNPIFIETNPNLRQWVRDEVNELYNLIEEEIENVRDANASLRTDAEEQLELANDEINELSETALNLQKRLDDYE